MAGVPNMLLSGIVGSTAYGLAGPDSDVDRLGVYAAPTVAFHGLNPPTGRDASIVSHDPDTTYHEAAKAAALMLGGNPTVTEILWLPDDLYEVRTALGDEMIAIRRAFLSAKRTRDAYFGYAVSQLERLLRTGQFQSKMRKRQAKHGRHLLRLLDQGFHLYATGELPIRVTKPQRYIDFGEAVAADPQVARPVLAEADERFNSVQSALPAEPDRPAIEAWLHRVRRAYLDPA
ncbi:nucleotidyltransferase [Micromonospora sp. WP24]|uniref:nucleotidyltransferase domain-containing protein n=1 Tax=Micromonospora sp. WP24 TaxID=2604469 RepID=UPI0011D3A1D6|nr:nucleotidyltransferase domain-containing protein [Micromonospora sp. WP24]TYC01678.1 nucleotidyltransferase [Micromonospora sp. WP24]